MEDIKDEPEEENHFDRRKKYRELVKGGMTDKEATEKVWPTSAATIAKNVKEKSDKDEEDRKEKKGKKE